MNTASLKASGHTAVSSQVTEEWLHCENNLNGIRARPNNSLATFTEFPKKYQPGADPYFMPLYEVSKETCEVFRSLFPDPKLEARYFTSDKILFPVHPVNLDNEEIPHISEITLNPLQSCLVSPTSSTRTVYVLDSSDLSPHCLKPHTDLRITRWRRHMEARKVKHAVAITRIFERSEVFDKDPKLAYFPESLGAVYRGKSNQSTDWGFILREMHSKPHLDAPRRMIPLCSLYLTESEKPHEEPLLVGMIKKSDKKPSTFILEEILFPILRGWANIYLETGVLLEPHGQNVIVEIDPESGEITRFAHRDFDCEVNIDLFPKGAPEIKELNSRDIFQNNDKGWGAQGSHLSILFDNSMQVPMEALAEIANKYFSVPKEVLRGECRKFLAENFPTLMEHFPQDGKAYNYKKTKDAIIIEERAEPPKWR